MKRTMLAALFLIGVFAFSLHAYTPEVKIKGGKVIFKIDGGDVDSVAVAGSFNSWSKDADIMEGPDDNGNWIYEKKLPAGDYKYKFVINGDKWVPEGYGNDLSFTVKGTDKNKTIAGDDYIDFVYIEPKAKDVKVAGSFNNWTGAAMAKGKNGAWEYKINVKPGKYEYKFIIDGQWQEGNNRKIDVVKLAKFTFEYKAPKAKKVTVAGSFNDWNKDALALDGPDKNGVFTKTVKLDAGKYEYKYVIDGEWMEGDNLVAEVGLEPVEVEFAYESKDAKTVNLVGAFNKWGNAQDGKIDMSIGSMKNDGSGHWTAKLKLLPGDYEYKFVVNGDKWVGDKDGNNLKKTVK